MSLARLERFIVLAIILGNAPALPSTRINGARGQLRLPMLAVLIKLLDYLFGFPSFASIHLTGSSTYCD